MATQTKFQIYSANLVKGVHNFNSNTIKVMLTNTAPNAATNAVLADITEISAGNGYTAGGTATTLTLSNTSGTEKIVATDVVFTASGGSFGPFRYAVISCQPVSPDSTHRWGLSTDVFHMASRCVKEICATEGHLLSV